MQHLLVSGDGLEIADVARVARERQPVRLCVDARREMLRSLAWVRAAANGELVCDDGQSLPVYGVNTGYGSLARVRIPPSEIRALSWNLIRSHAAGVGPSVPADAVRAMMLLRANALAKGASGCRPAVVDAILAMLDAGVTPDVPSQGSCGSSGDLAPLSHLALVVFSGEPSNDEESGWATYEGERVRGAEAMRRAGIERLQPGPKEGLAVTNGAQLSTAIAALAWSDAAEVLAAAEVAAAMSWEALRGVTRALHPSVHALRPYPGALACARNLLRLVEGSTLVDSLPDKVQDAYSLRCTPQVLGAVRDGMTYVGQQLRVELNSATDNPLILVDTDDRNKAFSAGLFHGEPVGMAADHLKLTMCELAAISERRLYRLTTGTLSARLPPLLAGGDRPGLGLMAPQTTAAALVSENRALAWPASADSIPTCEDQEDHVAMSTTAARRAAEVVQNARRVVAIELLCAASGLWWRLKQEPSIRLGVGTASGLLAVEDALGGRGGPAPSEDIERIAQCIASGDLLGCVAEAVELEGVPR